MQITVFKAILARRINIRGCEDYKNTFARIESDCSLRFGFKALIKSISYTKQANLFLHFFHFLFYFLNASCGPSQCSYQRTTSQVQ